MSAMDPRNWRFDAASPAQTTGANAQPDPGRTTSENGQTPAATTPSGAEPAAPLSLPSISLPKGGGAIRGIDEKLTVNPVSGTASLTVGVFTSPARQGFGPSLALSYDSGVGNGPFGLGWNLAVPTISRKTSKGLPHYDDTRDCDVFMLSGAEDLVPLRDERGVAPLTPPRRVGSQTFEVRTYRPRVEAGFARVERWTDTTSGDVHWRTVSANNVTSLYGQDRASRIADPADPARIFSWLLDLSFDDRGNAMRFIYKPEDNANVAHSASEAHRAIGANRYLKRILYGNDTPYLPATEQFSAFPTRWCFQVVLDYGEHDLTAPTPAEDTTWACRPDPFSTYRSCFEVRTYRLCRRLLMFHQMSELGGAPVLVRSTDVTYTGDTPTDPSTPVLSMLATITQTGWIGDADGNYVTKQLPPLRLGYSPLALDDTLHTLGGPAAQNVIGAFDGVSHRWVDLDGEGLAGILTNDGGAWYYQHNVSTWNPGGGRPAARFDPVTTVATKPSPAATTLVDLNGKGDLCAVDFSQPAPGWFEYNPDAGWSPFRLLCATANVDFNDPNLRFVDLDGDGLSDVLITEDQVFTWYPWEANEGFGPASRVFTGSDAAAAPAVVLADGTLSIHLADMSGDGLTDLVRVRNGEICYWPNLGYGNFGAKVTMDNAPLFDHADLFNEHFITFADIDGSGTADLVYLGARPAIWFNQSGNSWTAGHELTQFPVIPAAGQVQASVFDLLGTGTACAVWTSPLPQDATAPLRYVDLTAGVKPYLLTTVANNLGAQRSLTYAPSTKFYLQDRAAGMPWVTRLPFPVQVVEKVHIEDAISRTSYTSRYTYHHGHYDGIEREFRGFARVDADDTDTLPAQSGMGTFTSQPATDDSGENFALPTVHTVTWYHTGAYFGAADIAADLKSEYWQQDSQAPQLPATILPARATSEALREAARALRGHPIRQEVYAADNSRQAENPYITVEYRYQVDQLQPPAAGTNDPFYPRQYGSFHPWQREALTCHYERNPIDPRVSHDLALTIDSVGNVTSTASVGYPRREPAFDEQTTTWVSYSQTDYTNVTDKSDWYRIGVPTETRHYQLTGATATCSNGLFDPDVLNTTAAAAADIPYEATPGGGVQRRLLSRQRTYYRSDSLAATPLPQGHIDSLALVAATYTQRYTEGLLSRTLGTKFTVAVRDLLTGAGALVDVDSDGILWAPSAQLIYCPDPTDPDPGYAQAHFYQPTGALDLWNNLSTVAYDDHNLFVARTQDALGNTTVAEYNYRVLGPWLTTDANLNRAGVRYDALGMITATAVMGKAQPDGTYEGDYLDTSSPEPSPGDDPTTTLDYQLAAYMTWAADPKQAIDRPAPVWAHTRARVEHKLAGTAWIESYAYTDGFGRVALIKAQAEPGEAPQRDAATGVLIRDDHGELEFADTDTRWVGSGRVVYDNKGNPVKAYEPFFDSTRDYNDETDLVEWGVTALIRYDPLNRAIRVDNPNGTFRSLEFDPWQTVIADENDTVRNSKWYKDRIGGQFGPAEKGAAVKTAAHAETPTITNADTLGRVFQTIANNGPLASDQYTTTVTRDIQGRILATHDALGRTILSCYYDMSGGEIHLDSADSGKRWLLTNAGGQPLRAWDSRGHHVSAGYDALHRPTTLEVTDSTDTTRLAEQITYGETLPQAQTLNLRGAPYQHRDQAGIATTTRRDFKNNVVTATSQLLNDYIDDVDWSANPALDSETFTTTKTYDALNRVKNNTAPDGSITTATYNPRGLLAAVSVNVNGEHTVTDVVTAVSYNAKAQRRDTAYGNGAICTYRYDPDTFRLINITTSRPSINDTVATQIFSAAGTVQDVCYTYDPVGNVVLAEDTALQTIFYNNQIAPPTGDYTYDPIYRLVLAKGREHISDTLPQTTWNDLARIQVQPNDIQAMQPYAEHYTYDPVGNFNTVKHNAKTKSWTRTYTYTDPTNNQLTSTAVGATTDHYTYDVCGNITAMPHLSLMQWDWKNQLAASASQTVNNGTPETTYYRYDSTGQRVIKVVNDQSGTRRARRIYLGDCEIYREYDTSGHLTLERSSLHVNVGGANLCLLEITTTDASAPSSVPNTLTRYQFGNSIGSTAIELDSTAALISYEEYYPYGCTSLQTGPNQAEVSLKRYRYTGKERDNETGFTYHGARYYAPWLGRWTSCDPAGTADGTNVYSYSHNSPTNNVDMSGMQSEGVVNTGNPNDPNNYVSFEDFSSGAVGPWTEEGLRAAWDEAHPPAPPPLPAAAPATYDTISATSPEQARHDRQERIMNWDIPPEQVSIVDDLGGGGVIGEDYLGYAFIYHVKKLFAPKPEIPDRDHPGKFKPVPWQVDRSDEAVQVLSDLSTFVIPEGRAAAGVEGGSIIRPIVGGALSKVLSRVKSLWSAEEELAGLAVRQPPTVVFQVTTTNAQLEQLANAADQPVIWAAGDETVLNLHNRAMAQNPTVWYANPWETDVGYRNLVGSLDFAGPGSGRMIPGIEIHHFNYPRAAYPGQLMDPGNLFLTYPSTHTQIHAAFGGTQAMGWGGIQGAETPIRSMFLFWLH